MRALHVRVFIDKRAYLCIGVVSGRAGKAGSWPGGAGGGHGPSGVPFAGHFRNDASFFKQSFVLGPFGLWWASNLFGDLSGSQAGREEEEDAERWLERWLRDVLKCICFLIDVNKNIAAARIFDRKCL